jgi:hypothetical protein
MSIATESPGAIGRATDEPSMNRAVPRPELPRWPMTALFGAYALWWVLGVIDVIIIPLAGIMAILMVTRGRPRVPRAFGVWLFFLVWALFSVIMVTKFSSVIGFGYRYLIYVASTVCFVYVYNARRQLNATYVLGLMTCLWVVTVVGGYLGVVDPSGGITTPMAYVVREIKAYVPGSATLLNNELITKMVVRRFSQFNSGSYFHLSPRPAAPFRFTNNWGNVYSVLLPMVVAYLLRTRGWRKVAVGVALPLSAVPALLTLNRGMLLGVGLAMAYASFRLLLMGRPKFVLWMGLAAVVGAVLFTVLPVQERLNARLGFEGSSTQTRASLYQQSLSSIPASPFFGYGVPLTENDPNSPPVGTQGQVWMILVSHGPLGLASSVGWFLIVIYQTRRRRDVVGLAAHTSVVVGTVELFYYGVLPYGLPLVMVAAALALRPADETTEQQQPQAGALPAGARRRPIASSTNPAS